MTIPFIAGSVFGYLVGKDGRQEPVDMPSAVELLRSQKPMTYRVVTIDMSQARANEKLSFVGNFVGIKDIDSTVDLKIRLNEEGNDLLNLSRLRQIKNHLYYQLFLTNDAGSGSLELFLASGAEFIPPDDTSVDVTSDPGMLSGTLASRPAASLANRLYFATDVLVLYRDTGSAWAYVASGITADVIANRPASPSAEHQLFWATDENIIYRGTAALAWEKMGLTDHADLDGVTADDHHSQSHGHTGGDGSGTVAHSNLTGVGATDHHGDLAHEGKILSGTLASRPAAGTLDRYYWATDENILYHDTGSSWEKAAVADHADLDGVTADDHHGQSHAHNGADGSGTVAHSDLTGQTVNDHHNQSHAVAGGDHSASGLTAGHVMRATGTTTFAFQAIQDGDIPSTIARDSELAAAVTYENLNANGDVGSGATQVAQGDHTHTLSEAQSGSNVANLASNDTDVTARRNSGASGTSSVSTTLSSVGSGSRVVGSGSHFSAVNGGTHRVLIGGVEAASGSNAVGTNLTQGSRNVSGSVAVAYEVLDDGGVAHVCGFNSAPAVNALRVSALEVAP